MPVSLLNASAVSMHLDPDHMVVVEWLKGIWRQKHRCFEVGNVYEHEGVNLRFSDSYLPKEMNKNIFIPFFIFHFQ